jgi:single-stranded DNA-binding protein
MATDINTCTFSGHVVADPKSFAYGDNKMGVRFRLGINNYGDKTAWASFTAFNGLAEKVIMPYVKKGSLVFIVASMETRPMDGLHNAEGKPVNRTDTSFIVRDLKLGGSNPNGSDRSGQDVAPADAPAPVAAEEESPF